MSLNGDSSRETVLRGIRRELLGPAGCGYSLEIPHIGEPVDAFLPYVDAVTGQEVLTVEKPLNRYGLGVLYPKFAFDSQAHPVVAPDELTGAIDETSGPTPNQMAPLSAEAERALDKILERNARSVGDEAGDDDVSSDFIDTTRRQASSMAVSFRVRSSDGSKLVVTLPEFEPGTALPVNGRYEEFTVEGRNPRDGSVKSYKWWVRRQVMGTATFELPRSVEPGERVSLRRISSSMHGEGPLGLEFSAFARRFAGSVPEDLVVTVVLSNRSRAASSFMADDRALFQAYFEAALDGHSASALVKLPGRLVTDRAAKSLDLIYRKFGAMAVGHGCSGTWRTTDEGDCVVATHFPSFEVASMTPELTVEEGGLEVSMAALAGLTTTESYEQTLRHVTDSYDAWLAARTLEGAALVGEEQVTASHHLEAARAALERMRAGIKLITTNEVAHEAFRLMNHAMLLQQVASRSGLREFIPGKDAGEFARPYVEPSLERLPEGRGRWRPFQIGFILAALASTTDPEAEDRDIVDLIWFPTGGGKTEAYLGLSAYSAFLRRLRSPDDAGTEVLMRYTLRLLTAQQFERASSLVCAMDWLRRRQPEKLGTEPFSIGLWVGQSTTPNSWVDAKRALVELTKGGSKNPFLVTRCPWCGAQIGPVGKGRVLGYVPKAGTVEFRCPDPRCAFRDGLPVHVVDEGLYDRPPTILIATVDKYAQLSWNPKPRAFFGLGEDGDRATSPPNLIIQDELHLITGPLGTMVGSYEVIVDHLARHRTEPPRRPKIVCSTATVRNFEDQVRWLFARKRTSLFPPPVLDIDDSFFGVKARNSDGSDAPGRKYVGIFSPALGSHMTVQIRVYAAVLQSVMALPAERRDPYWTLLGFFNTLRDLGSTTTLLRDQIQNQLLAMWRRHGVLGDDPDAKNLRRTVYVVEELTGRLRSEEVPVALDRLANELGSTGKAVDVCLASNMIEVGIDVDRLGLMVVTGQPKTNAQYIQVTGRVGRDWAQRPGLVVIAYAPNRARDRSVFETFRANHERMYAAVEPASVTPFSLPALQRALHATMIAYIRQKKPLPFDNPSMVEESELLEFRDVLAERIEIVAPDASEDFERQFDLRVKQWQMLQPLVWEDRKAPDNSQALQVPASSQVGWADRRWRTPQSMRNVDAECLVDTSVVNAVELTRLEDESAT